MANALQAKTDVVNELRNKLYYNQLEIQRLLSSPSGISHKEVVDTVVHYLRENVLAIESISLIESYFSQPQPTTIPEEATKSVEEELGVKKVD